MEFGVIPPVIPSKTHKKVEEKVECIFEAAIKKMPHNCEASLIRDLISASGSEVVCNEACKCNADYKYEALLVSCELCLCAHTFEKHEEIVSISCNREDRTESDVRNESCE